jgi:hypothetical protein
MSDQADLTKLSKDDVAKFQKVLNDSIDQSLAISFNAACSASESDEAALVYEINTAAIDGGATHDAVAAALGGDWTQLATLDGKGTVRKLRDVVIDTLEKKYSLNVNLLGLYNYRSVGDFVLNVSKRLPRRQPRKLQMQRPRAWCGPTRAQKSITRTARTTAPPSTASS